MIYLFVINFKGSFPSVTVIPENEIRQFSFFRLHILLAADIKPLQTDTDQAQQNVEPVLDPNCLTL